MRVVVYGAGAVGGVIGGRLAASGQDVVLVARGAHGRAIAGSGLRIDDPEGSATVRVPVVERADDVDWRDGDVVLLAVKSQDTVAAAQSLAASAGDVPVVSAQNGVSNEATLLRWFSAVYGIWVVLPATHLEPGVVQAQSAPVPGILDVGRFPGGVDDTATALALALEKGGFVSVPRPDIMRWKHRKLVGNLANGVQALLGPVSGDDVRAVVARLGEEAEAVFAAAGVDVASAAEDEERRGAILRVGTVAGQERTGGSTWQSMRRGTPVETDWLNGEVAALGRLHGVPTPANVVVQRLTAAAARRGDAPGTLTPADLRAAVESAAR